MSVYSNNITLKDLFNNKSIQKKLPLGNYKEQLTYKSLPKNAQLRIIGNQIKDLTASASTKYYNQAKVTRTNRTIVVSGSLKKSYNSAFNGIYNYIKGKAGLISNMIANNEIIRNAFIEDIQNGKSSKLYLRIASVNEIKSMNANRLKALMNDIIDNIKFSDNFPKTQTMIETNLGSNFLIQKQEWMKKVGFR